MQRNAEERFLVFDRSAGFLNASRNFYSPLESAFPGVLSKRFAVHRAFSSHGSTLGIFVWRLRFGGSAETAYMTPNSRLLTRSEAAEVLRCSTRTLFDLSCPRGSIPVIR